MFRPMHFVLFFAAIAFVVATPVPGDVDIGRVPEPNHAEETVDTLDLEPSASSWGYAQPSYVKQYGWNGRGSGWSGRSQGWNGGNGWSGRSQGWNGGNGWYGKSQGWSGRGTGWW